MPRLRSDLLRWYDATRRDLPWRRDTDPYRVLVSEVMLQQTRVDVVVPYFEAWIARWPTVEDLSKASLDEVVAAWSGLGYYQRVRRLHAAAVQVAEQGWPEDLTDLPGVGPYVAGALGSIAFGHLVAAVDGNVQRVVARWFALDDDLGTAAGRGRLDARAAELVRPDRPGDWTQAIMELGALVCTPASPHCHGCPVAQACSGREDPTRFPVRAPKPRPRDEAVHFAAIVDGDRLLLTRRGPGLLAGTWGLPGGSRDADLVDLVREQAGLDVHLHDAAGEASHTFSHRRWHLRVHRADVLGGEPEKTARWTPLSDLDQAGLSTAMRKAIGAVGLRA